MGIILSLHNIQSGYEHKMKLKSQKQIKEMKHFTKIIISWWDSWDAKRWNYLSKELTSLLCSSCQLSTEDQEKDQVSEKSGAENEEREEKESQAPGEKKARRKGRRQARHATVSRW